jgi:hypothetical protein
MPRLPRVPFLLAAAALAGCTFHSTATTWHDRVGIDGKPMFLTTTTKYGFALFVVIPLLGDTRTAKLVDETTASIAAAGGNRLRVVETESANYWYAIPPLSWFVAPVMGSVSVEYTPSDEQLAKLAAEASKEPMHEREARHEREWRDAVKRD